MLEKERPVAKFEEKDISAYFWPQGKEPDSEEYRAHLGQQFQNYKLKVGGLVENPVEFSYAELQSMPKSEQITQHYCIQGWSGIAKWGGVPVSEIIKIVRPRPEAHYVIFYSFAHGFGEHAGLYYDAISMTYRALCIWDMADLLWLLNSYIAPDRFCQILNSFRCMA